MDLKRIGRHLAMTHWQVRRAFPQSALAAIEAAIKAGEATHAGEIRFVVEGALDSAALFRNQTARERALDVFSQLRIWDTEHNNGLLVYLLLADRAVEIVADRGIHAKVGTPEWEQVCRSMEAAFRQTDYAGGVVGGIRAVAAHLSRHFPMDGGDGNELPDQPLVL